MELAICFLKLGAANPCSTGPRSPRIRDEYLAPIPEAERHDMILAYHAQLNSVDDATRIKAAKAWSKWECVGDLFPTLGYANYCLASIEWPHQSYM